jgi:hypothetical protein
MNSELITEGCGKNPGLTAETDEGAPEPKPGRPVHRDVFLISLRAFFLQPPFVRLRRPSNSVTSAQATLSAAQVVD